MNSIDLTVDELVAKYPNFLKPHEVANLKEAEKQMNDDLDNLKRTPDHFRPDTLNYQIFNLNAPYANPYQGTAPRWLFVCSAGLLRSPTAAHVGITMGANARSCGSHTEYALIPLSANLIAWADYIFFVNPENHKEALRTFKNTGWEDDINSKAVIWNIPDRYEFGHPELFNIIRNHLLEYAPETKKLT